MGKSRIHACRRLDQGVLRLEMTKQNQSQKMIKAGRKQQVKASSFTSHFHHHSYCPTMSATSAPLVTCIPISSPPPSPSPLAVSAPENMPVMPLNLQLARCTEPLPAMEQDDDAATSVIEYGSVATPEPTSDTPTGFVPNNIDGRHFYPIYVKNPKYSKWDLEPKMVVTEYIRYSIDYTEVTGTMGQGHKQRTTPVQVGRRACYYAAMTTAMWRDLERGSSKEFAVNDCLADIGDAHITREINQFRGYAELRQTLNRYLLDAQKEVMKVTKEVLKVEDQLTQCRNQLKRANVYQELQCHSSARKTLDTTVMTTRVESMISHGL
jgi:hypothetical protein